MCCWALKRGRKRAARNTRFCSCDSPMRLRVSRFVALCFLLSALPISVVIQPRRHPQRTHEPLESSSLMRAQMSSIKPETLIPCLEPAHSKLMVSR